MGGVNWTPIGYLYTAENQIYSSSFNGVLEGNNKTIRGLKVNNLDAISKYENSAENATAGLFGATVGAVITDLKVENASINLTKEDAGELTAGIIVGTAYKTRLGNITVSGNVVVNGNERTAAALVAGTISQGTIDTIELSGKVSGTVKTPEKSLLAGLLFGNVSGTTAVNVKAEGDIEIESGSVIFGGIVAGYAEATKVKDSNLAGKIITKSTGKDASVMVGGVIGSAVKCEDTNCIIKPVINAEGTSNVYTGGSYGFADGIVSTGAKIDSTVGGKTSGKDCFSINGGAVGYAVDSEANEGEVKANLSTDANTTNCTGGFAGRATGTKLNKVKIDVKLKASSKNEKDSVVFVGGVAGDASDCNMTDTDTTGEVAIESKFDGYAGGIAGMVSGGSYTKVNASVKITNNSASGTVSGGLVGHATGKETFKDCVPTKDRTNTGKNIYDKEDIAITEAN